MKKVKLFTRNEHDPWLASFMGISFRSVLSAKILIFLHLFSDPVEKVVDSSERPRNAFLHAMRGRAERGQANHVPATPAAPADERAAAVAGAGADAAVAEAVVAEPVHVYFPLTIVEFPNRRNALLHLFRHLASLVLPPAGRDAILRSFIIRI